MVSLVLRSPHVHRESMGANDAIGTIVVVGPLGVDTSGVDASMTANREIGFFTLQNPFAPIRSEFLGQDRRSTIHDAQFRTCYRFVGTAH